MPNKWNFSYDYFYSSVLALLIYVPGKPPLLKSPSILLFAISASIRRRIVSALDHRRKPTHVPLHALPEEEGAIKGQSGMMMPSKGIGGLVCVMDAGTCSSFRHPL
jgi:hypothetical protein